MSKEVGTRFTTQGLFRKIISGAFRQRVGKGLTQRVMMKEALQHNENGSREGMIRANRESVAYVNYTSKVDSVLHDNDIINEALTRGILYGRPCF